MRKLTKPTTTSIDAFTRCVSGIKDTATQSRYLSVQNHIQTATSNFDAAATTGTLHTIPEEIGVASILSKDDMNWLYTEKMVDTKSPGRIIYDSLMLAPKGRTCPLCGAGKVSTLDHHLPKSKFSPLAVAPTNLIPACKDCNTTKKTKHPHTTFDQTFHPYFDDFGNERWLFATVLSNPDPSLIFSVRPPSSWPAITAQRTQFHFDAFDLGRFYSSLAATELTNIRYRLMQLFTQSGALAVQEHLEEEAISREVADRNSWQTATYRALSSDLWFCAEGFALVPLS